MKATLENISKLNEVINNLQSQVNSLYNGEWNNEKSVKEDELCEMINFLADERNNMYPVCEDVNEMAYIQCQY